MAAKRDYYDVLNIGRDADEAAVKRAYRKLAVKFHPDRNPDDPTAAEKFREATEAYEVIRDPQKRAQYDRFGHAATGQGFGDAGGGFTHLDLNEALDSFLRNFGGFGGLGGFGDLFGGAGGAGGAGRAGRGRDLQIKVKLTLHEAAGGVKKRLKVKKLVACGDCHGTGGAPGSRTTACSQCGGVGRVRQVRQSLIGQMVTEGACPRCRGRGQVVSQPCRSCNGTGVVRGEETLELQVPPGVSTGNFMEIPGRGDLGEQGGPAGDLRVVMEVAEDDVFERHGDDVLIDVPISPIDLMLGVKIEVPTIDGRVALRIPPGTHSHKVFRMRGKGLPRLNHGGRGDQLVRVLAWTPPKLSAEETAQLERVRDSLARQVPAPGRHHFD